MYNTNGISVVYMYTVVCWGEQEIREVRERKLREMTNSYILVETGENDGAEKQHFWNVSYLLVLTARLLFAYRV